MKTFGIIGGAGPLATARIHRMVVDLAIDNGAHDDADFPNMVITSSGIPSGTATGSFLTEEVFSHIDNAAVVMKAAKPDSVIMACNTLHAHFSEISARHPELPWTDLVQMAINALPDGISKVAVLTSESSQREGVYAERLTKSGMETVYPEDRELVTALIDSSMDSEDISLTSRVCHAVKELVEDGAQAVILGCTELSLYHQSLMNYVHVPVIDSSFTLASHIVKENLS